MPGDDDGFSAPIDPLIGRNLGGRYRLISRLGTGGMSTVYLARHVLIDRLMAIKSLRRDLAADPIQRDRFLREARAVNRINHENIVEITDYGETDDGLAYLVMEYVPGESLLRAMDAGPMPEPRAIHLAMQIGQALARAHQMGVIHRDLKPENILLVPRKGQPDFVKILDFGIAKILDAPSLTGSQQIFGTPGYIAPEYIQSTQIDGRADLYSLGVMLYELVTGALPFDYQYPGDLLVKHVTDPPVPPSKRLPSVSGPVEAFILRCLTKDPDERFRDAYHFVDELRRVSEVVGPETHWAAMNEPPNRPTFVAGLTPDEGSPLGGRTIPSGPPELMPAAVPTLSEPRLPRETDELRRMTIPEAPSIELVSRADADEPLLPPSTPKEAIPFDQKVDGIIGVRRWRRRCDALRKAVEQETSPPEAIERALATAEGILESFEGDAVLASQKQLSLEERQKEARRFRLELGASIDDLAGRLSLAERSANSLEEELATRRSTDREDRISEFSLWAEGALEQEVATRRAEVVGLTKEVARLREELTRRNEEAEGALFAESERLDRDMEKLEAKAAALRGLLNEVEDYVRTQWGH
ncbi:MAG: protein kinase [Myxococcota bacterium]